MRRGRSPDACLNTMRDRLPSDLDDMSFTSLQGKLLIASPALLDPNFVRTVVLITEHTEEAAMGLVLNRPTSISVRDAVPILAELVDAEEPVYEGGPVQPEAVVALAEFDDPNDSAAIAFGRIGFLRADGDPGAIRTVEQHVRVFCGYAGLGRRPARGRARAGGVDRGAGARGRPLPRLARPLAGRRCGASAAATRCSRSCRTIRRPTDRICATARGGSTPMSTPDATPLRSPWRRRGACGWRRCTSRAARPWSRRRCR